MKKVLTLILLVIQSFNLYSQKYIQMEPYGGVYRIPCKINGAKMKMIFDTGASSVSLSQSMAEYLFDNDYITKNDIIGKGQSETASGEIVNNININLRDIEIDDIHLKNVKAIVISSQNAPLLLGLSAIQQLGPVTIEGNRLKINQVNSNILSDDEIEKLSKEADELFEQKQYFAAAEIYSKLRNDPGLTTYGYACLIKCYNNLGKYDLALSIFKEWENSEEAVNANDKDLLYLLTITCWTTINTKDQSFRVHVLEKTIALEQKIGYKIDAEEYSQLADAYINIADFNLGLFYRKKAISQYLIDGNIKITDIYDGYSIPSNVKASIGRELYMYSLEIAISKNYDTTEAHYYLMQGAAKCGDEQAIDFCSKKSLNYIQVKYNNRFSYLF